jgi:type III pantothenate kinase
VDLAVDIGNSALKLALVEAATVVDVTRLDSADASEANLDEALATLARAAPTASGSVVATSVVDRWTERLERVAQRMGLPLTVVSSSGVPIRTALPRPDQTGTDRMLGAWAASRIHGVPVIVVSLGTATTVDAVDADGFFLGGAIMPGIGLGADALAGRTARLPRIELDLPETAIGSDTLAAMRSGLLIGHVGAIRELVTRMRPALGSGAPRVVVSGGHAAAAWAPLALLEPAAPDLPAVADRLEPDLVLKGLGLFAADEEARFGRSRSHRAP